MPVPDCDDCTGGQPNDKTLKLELEYVRAHTSINTNNGGAK